MNPKFDKLKNVSGIYKLFSKIDNKIYIGSATDLYLRIINHKKDMINNNHHNKHIQNFVNKYGINNIDFEILELCDKKLLLEREQYFIDTLNPLFNICRKAESRIGVKASELTKRRISLSRIGNKYSLGTKRSVETKLKMSKLQKEMTLGEKNGRSKLKECDVLLIRQMAKDHTRKYLAEKFNVDNRSISNIVLGKSWKHLLKNYGK